MRFLSVFGCKWKVNGAFKRIAPLLSENSDRVESLRFSLLLASSVHVECASDSEVDFFRILSDAA